MSTKSVKDIPVISIDDISKDGITHIGDDIFLAETIIPKMVFPDEFKVREYMSYYITKGSVQGRTNGVDVSYTAPLMIILQPEDTYSFYRASDDLNGTLIVFSERFCEQLNILYYFRLNSILRSQMSMDIDDNARQVMNDYYNQLVRIASYEDNPLRFDAALNLTRAFFYGIGSCYYHNQKKLQLNTRSKEIADEFLELTEKYGSTQRKMDFYSEKMRLSSKYIAAVVLKETGYPTTYWIEQATIHEAKHLLSETTLTIQQIGNQLKFSDQAYFGAYFKRLCGMSPKNFRLTNK